jgi:hypothetical protein
LVFFKQVANMMPSATEIWLVGDTEFQSVCLLGWFGPRNWPFAIRQQGKNKVCWAG